VRCYGHLNIYNAIQKHLKLHSTKAMQQICAVQDSDADNYDQLNIIPPETEILMIMHHLSIN
jgi:hypothetical protein